MAALHAQVKQLVEAADAVGAVLVYRHQGFLPNTRQLRMGGLAALEMAQTLRHLVCHPSHAVMLCNQTHVGGVCPEKIGVS